MEKLNNPFTKIQGYNCFGCSPNNPHGLQMEFYLDGNEVIFIWDPKPYFNGYGNILHGGIHTTLMDELASWVIYIKLQTAGITKNISVDFIKPVYTDKGSITLKTIAGELKDNISAINVKLYDFENTLRSEGNICFFIYPQDLAIKRLYYPGLKAFINKNN